MKWTCSSPAGETGVSVGVAVVVVGEWLGAGAGVTVGKGVGDGAGGGGSSQPGNTSNKQVSTMVRSSLFIWKSMVVLS